MSENTRQEVTTDELKMVSGGYVIKEGDTYYVIDDKSGRVLNTSPVETLAKMSAKYQGNSDRLISADEYREIFGRDF